MIRRMRVLGGYLTRYWAPDRIGSVPSDLRRLAAHSTCSELASLVSRRSSQLSSRAATLHHGSIGIEQQTLPLAFGSSNQADQLPARLCAAPTRGSILFHRQLLVGFSRMHLSVASACRESQISCLPCRHDASLALSAPNFALGRRDERGWQGHLEIWARLRSPISSINFQPVRCESLAGLAGAKIELPLPGTRASNNQVFACRECIGAPLLDRA